MARRQAKYTIPKGTTVQVRNLISGKVVNRHVIRKTLEFEERTNTGFNFSIYYFRYQDWLIAVNAQDVQ